MYTKLVTWWLRGILLFLPFQSKIILIARQWNQGMSTFLGRLDEFTVGLLFPLALIELYRENKINNRPFVILFSSVIAIFFCGLISGTVNNNPHIATIHGAIEYIKYFLVIFIYAAFLKERDEFKKVFRLVLIVTIFISVIAFMQEVWAIYNKYVLDISADKISHFEINDLIDRDNSLFSSGEWQWRLGIYRVSSFMVNHTSLGMYCLLIFTTYSFIMEKWNIKFIIPLLFIMSY